MGSEHDLNDEEFDKLAREQVIKYPHLLLFDNEEGVVKRFYDHYRRINTKINQKNE